MTPTSRPARHIGLTEPAMSPDGRLLVVSRGVRGLADGAVAVALSAYLTHLGFSGGRIGLIVTCMLMGSAR